MDDVAWATIYAFVEKMRRTRASTTVTPLFAFWDTRSESMSIVQIRQIVNTNISNGINGILRIRG